MSGKSIISNAYLEDIGDAIRQKKETDETYYPSQMGDAIRSIEGIVPSGTLDIDANGTYDVTQYAEATVDIPDPVITSLTATEDGTYSVPEGVDGYNPVTVNTGVAELQEEIDSAIEASGCDPLVDGIAALTAQANAKTGASDTTLADAVGTLIGGYTSDIYPIGEDVVSRYIGRDWSNASVPMIRGNVNYETGLYEPDENGDYNISLIYIPVSPSYQYTKSGSAGFLYRVLFYDEDKNFLSGLRFTPNWNIWFSFVAPAEAKYMRIATHTSNQYKNVYIFRSA